MEQRKIIKFGNNSYVISLPKKWVQENALTKGTPLYIQEQDNTLRITSTRPTHPHQDKELRLDGSQDLEALKLNIISAYINNYKRIIILNPREKVHNIRNILHNTIALEIIEQTPNIIVAQDYLDLEEISIQELLKQSDVLIRSMLSDTNTLIAKKQTYKNTAFAQEISERDEDINRLTLLAHKTIKYRLTKANEDAVALLNFWETTKTLEKIGDEIKRVVRLLIQRELQRYKELIYLLRDVETHHSNIMDIYYANDKEGALLLAAKKHTRMEQATKLYKTYHNNLTIATCLTRILIILQYQNILLRMTYQ